MTPGSRTTRLAVLLLPLVLVSIALACRYTVRDIGFVRLAEPAHQLVLIGGAFELDDVQMAMGDVPLRVVKVDPAHEPEHPAVIATRSSGHQAALLDREGRVLAVADPMSIGHTPLARKLAEDASSTFAFVLLLESGDPTSDELARKEIESLQASLDAIEAHLPRPLGHPLRLLELDAAQQERERALLWSLGVDTPVTEPTVLVAYGRARRAGAPVTLSGSGRIDATRELLAQLALVGESCECDTSRAWTAEPVGLVPWSRDTHAHASGALGFDPESPMVRAEVVRILGRTQADRDPRSNRPESIEELLLGYAETTLEPVAPTPTSATGAVSDTSGNPAPRTRVLAETTGDDWSFDEPTPSAEIVENADPEQPSSVSSMTWVTLAMFAGLVAFSFIIGFAMLRRSGGGA